MKYVEKQCSDYLNYFLSKDSKEGSLNRNSRSDHDKPNISNEDISLKIQREAIASSSASKLEKQSMLQKLVQNFAQKELDEPKKAKKKKIITKMMKVRSSPEAPRSFSRQNSSRNNFKSSRQNTLLPKAGLPPLSKSKAVLIKDSSPRRNKYKSRSSSRGRSSSRSRSRSRSGSPRRKRSGSRSRSGSPDKADREDLSVRSTKSKGKRKVIRRFIKKVKK
ncbi:unnamed protein product [Moneuplotes crassus]|uniref:Uncharacterized protein n=1 Tax=Euplotes crassus TaxID=5936 RepID=A0AAD1UL25_EUPCR|nr:unnamed protein product [Moneuplotes crassus]